MCFNPSLKELAMELAVLNYLQKKKKKGHRSFEQGEKKTSPSCGNTLLKNYIDFVLSKKNTVSSKNAIVDK